MSVSGRLHPGFKIVFTAELESPKLQLNGPIETQDQLDALTEALAVMREWLPEQSERTGA